MTTLFAACAPGLEKLVEKELVELRMTPRAVSDGGVEFDGDAGQANLHLSVASRVLLRMGTFHAAAFPELRRKAAALSWSSVLRRGEAVALRVTAHKSRLFHTGAIAERITQAIGDALGAEPPVEKARDDEDQQARLIIVRLQRDEVTISADTSGTLLHRRGYRQATGKAPLRETLACAMLAAAEWKPGEALLDPFCGSGTIVLEAARIASGIPAGARRLGVTTTHVVPTEIHASDINHGALAAVRANMELAAFPVKIHVARRDAVDVEPPASTGLVLTNPPYGHRVGDAQDLHALHAAFGRNLAQRFRGWRVGMLSSDDALIRSTGLALSPVLRTLNGGMRVTLHVGAVK